MKDDSGSIRTSIQGQGGGAVADARLQAVISTAALDEADKSAWCQGHGM